MPYFICSSAACRSATRCFLLPSIHDPQWPFARVFSSSTPSLLSSIVRGQEIRDMRWATPFMRCTTLVGGTLLTSNRGSGVARRFCKISPPSGDQLAVEELHKAGAEAFERGDFRHAIRQWEAVMTAKGGANAGSVLAMNCLNNLACAYGEVGDHKRKLQLLKQSLQMVKDVYGENHPQYGMVLYNMACAYEEMGQYQEMEDLLLHSLVIHEKKFNPLHPKVGRVLLLLADAHGHLGKHEVQLQVAERAFNIVRRHCGANHMQSTHAMLTLARAHGANGNSFRRLQLAQHAYEIQEGKLGAMNPQLALTLLELADACGADGDHHRRKELLERAIEVQKRAFGSQHTLLTRTYTALGDVYGDLNDKENQASCYREALEVARQRYEGNHVIIGTAAIKCAFGYLRTGRVNKAKALAEEARGIIDVTVTENHPAAVELRALLEKLDVNSCKEQR
uniref:Kinesin light chain n=1 Tax=Trypanosoma congolense (strain IL3000) TaxID=1068625 RepID=G0UKT9_TRYCI|nr:conserved hypothetical protein [Trypanosoma congolense IL3000]